jgi:diguanylate cyclase (GGDEF)-like protein
LASIAGFRHDGRVDSATLRAGLLGLLTTLLAAAAGTPVARAQEASKPPPGALAPHLTRRVVVDGSLEEWDTAHPLVFDRGTQDPRPEGPPAWKGTADASADLHVCWDDERLYFGGRVTDDDRVVSPGALFLGDSIEVFLRIPEASGPSDYQLILSPLSQELRWVFARFRGKQGLTDGGFDGVEVAGREIRDAQGAYRGYAFEAAVPFANFPGFEPGGATVGCNLALVDADRVPGQKNYLLWAGTTLPAYAPSGVAPLRFEGARTPAEKPAEKGFEFGLERWRVPGLVIGGTLLLLALLYALRRPLKRIGNLPLRRRVPLALATAALLLGLRLVPGFVESRREARVAERLEAAGATILGLADEAARANVLVPGRTVESESPLLRLVEGGRVNPQPEYQYRSFPAVPREPRRTLASGTPVRDTAVPLDGAGRVGFGLADPVEAAELRVVLSWRDPGEGRTGPPPGTVVGRIAVVGTDAETRTLEIRMGREVDDEGAARADGHAAAESKVAWLELDPANRDGPPAGHADEVLWKLPGPPRRIARIEAEQTVSGGVLTLRGVTAIPAGAAEPVLVPLGRRTPENVPTSTWNGRPSSEVLRLGPGTAKASIPLGVEADAVFVIYGSPGGPAPDEAGKRVLALSLALEDGTRTNPVFLENGVNLDAERLPGVGHPEDFKGRLAFRWPGPDGTLLHRDCLEIPVRAPPGVEVASLEIEVLGGATRVDVDGVAAGRRVQRAPPPGLALLRVQSDGGFERAALPGDAFDGVFTTHYRAGRAVATTLPADLRDRVLGTEAPPEVAPRPEAGLGGGVYLRSVGGRAFLARQARLPFREADEVIETALPAPDVRDLEIPFAIAGALLLALFLTLALTSAVDALEYLPHLRWKLVAAFGFAAVLPLVVMTLFLARHFEEAVDRGIEGELQAHADAAARALAARRDEARRLAEDLLRDETLRRALDVPDVQDRTTRVDAVVRDFARRAAGGAARVSLERTPLDGAGEARSFPLGERPAPFQGLYEPSDGLDYRWSRLVATGVARTRTPDAALRMVVEIPVDDRVLQDVRRAGADRAQILLFSPDGYPVAGTTDLPAERSPESVAARRAVAGDLRRTPGEHEIRSRELGGLPHAVVYDLVRSADGRTAGLLATAIPRQPLLAATLGTRDLVFLLGSAAFLVAVLVANLVTRRVAGPVTALMRAARRIGDGDLRVRAADTGRDEIASLAAAFNRMTGQLEGRIGELSRLNESLATFSATLDRERVLALTVTAFRESAAPAAVLVVLAGAEGTSDVELAAGVRGIEPLAPGALPAAGFLGGAVRETAARRVPLPAETPAGRAASPAERALLEGAAEAVVLPFTAGPGRIEGAVVLLGGAAAAAEVPPASLPYLAALAHQAGIALENARLYRLAVEDPATGLYAASYFKRRLQEEIDRSAGAGRPASLLLLGVEGLGGVFDRLGPDEGNALLRAVVGRVRGDVRRMHLLARAGRDTVAVLLPETPKAAAEETAAAIRAAVEGAPFAVGKEGREVRLGLVPALATAPDDAGSAEFLENEALRSLERARVARRGAPAAPPAPAGPRGVDAAEAERLGFRSAKSLLLLDALNRIAASDVPVLILGETGAGKEVVADVLHAKSRRAAGPLVKVNCAALPGPLLEAELFGHEKGAFTGADRRHVGRFEQAHGGTLFLDEIGEFPPALQVKLLRVLQDRKVERLGGSGPVDVDVRVVAATNRDLPAMIEAGAFREDLYFRLNVLSVVVPPLRARREDIPPIAARFLEAAAARHGSGPTGFTPEALDFLFKHPFPGNVRELRNMVERAVVAAQGALVTVKDLSFGEEREGLRLAAPSVNRRRRRDDGIPNPTRSYGIAAAGGGESLPRIPAPVDSRNSESGTTRDLSPRAARLLDALRARGVLTNRDWCEESGVSSRTGLRDFEELMEKGLASRTGKRRSASYRPS